jgi:O-antigen/teichoic acid export membrane protein
MRGETEVGYYTAGYLLLGATLVPAQIINQAFFSSLSTTFGRIDQMRERAALFARTMAAFGFPVAVAGVALAGPLLVTFAGEAYSPGIRAFGLLMVNAGFVYVNMTFGQPLIAWNRQNAYFWAVGLGAVANVVLNVMLIPRYGIDGAAAATVLSECAVLVGLVYLHWKTAHALYLSTWIRAAIAAAIGVGGVIVGLQALGFSPLVAGLVSIFTYTLAAWALKVVDPKAVLEVIRTGRNP